MLQLQSWHILSLLSIIIIIIIIIIITCLKLDEMFDYGY
jgi:hypothetical protein